MNATDFSNWARRAFCYCEAALAEEIATPTHLCITEELVRAAFVRGLGHTKPSQAHRLETEQRATFSGNPCWNGTTHGSPSGRPIQHDIATTAGVDGLGGKDAGMVAEVKWLKANKSDEVARDLWKLAFVRGVTDHAVAPRCFMVLGGQAKAFGACLRSLRDAGADLRWSDAGRHGGPPGPTSIRMDDFWSRPVGRRAFNALLGWGSDGHIRQPPDCPRSVKLTRRAHWLRTLSNDPGAGSTSWRLVLWEVSTWGLGKVVPIPWATLRLSAGLRC